MPTPDLETYPTWHSVPLTMPLRTPFYHLQPCGVGTPFVESLASYVARLAQAHQVSSTTLVNQAIRPIAVKQFGSSMIGNIYSTATYRLNGLGIWTREAVLALQWMTGHSDLLSLTMLSWDDVLNQNNLLRHTRAWCPACYEQARQTQTVIYDQLLWSLAPVTYCPRHQQPLQSRCPQPDCQQTLPCISKMERLGYCPYCRDWLGRPASPKNTPPPDQTSWSAWVTFSLAELIAAAPNLNTLPSRQRFAELFIFLASHLTQGRITALARRFGLTSLYRFQRAACAPRVDHFLDLCYHLGLSPLQFLTQPLSQINLDQLKPPQAPQLRQYRWPRSRKPDHLQAAKQAIEQIVAADEDPPPSMHEVTRRLGHTESYLARNFPELWHQIAKRSQAYHTAKKRRFQQALEAVLSGSEHPPPSGNKVAKRLNTSRCYLQRNFPQLYTQVSKQYHDYIDARKQKTSST